MLQQCLIFGGLIPGIECCLVREGQNNSPGTVPFTLYHPRLIIRRQRATVMSFQNFHKPGFISAVAVPVMDGDIGNYLDSHHQAPCSWT